MSTTTSAALLEVDQFERRSSGTSWTQIRKRDLIDGLKSRLKDPDEISTRVVNLCGPGAFFRCLAEDDPVAYVKAVISLYETNSARLGTRTFKAGRDLQTALVASGMDAVDWILLASLRDDENLVLDYDNAGGTLSGLTMPAGLAKWFGNAKYSAVINETNVFFTKNLAHVQRAGSLHAGGNRVCLLINSQMLAAATQGNRSMIPNHWVVLMSGVSVDAAKNLSLKVQTWGVVKSVPGVGTLSASLFCRNYYGFVAARPPA